MIANEYGGFRKSRQIRSFVSLEDRQRVYRKAALQSQISLELFRFHGSSLHKDFNYKNKNIFERSRSSQTLDTDYALDKEKKLKTSTPDRKHRRT